MPYAKTTDCTLNNQSVCPWFKSRLSSHIRKTAYNPVMLTTMADIYRVYYNYFNKSDKSDKGETPAM
jgi:hypothetical protein